MADVKLTKNELRSQEIRLAQLEKYLPTLQLKKAMLQLEVNQAAMEIESLSIEYLAEKEKAQNFQSLLTDPEASNLFKALEVVTVKKSYENIAGVDIPHFQDVEFKPPEYDLFDTPLWLDNAIEMLRKVVSIKENIHVVEEKKEALEKELREVSIRVNLFEKILIPRALANIKKIKIFLGDQQLSSVAQAKVAKRKIQLRKEKAYA